MDAAKRGFSSVPERRSTGPGDRLEHKDEKKQVEPPELERNGGTTSGITFLLCNVK